MPSGYMSMHSMRSFDNNKPNLSSSDRIRNLKSKTIYEGAKKRFQIKGKCGSNKNVKYYSTGKLRSAGSYEVQRDLAKGNTLCEDCNGQGMLCGPRVTPDMLGKITMGNNLNSERWGGGRLGWNWTANELSQFPSPAVITSDVSGTWDPSAATVDDPSKNTLPTYGYVNNLFKVPRNLDGSGIVVDPSNTLFSDSHCDTFRYMRASRLKTTLVIRGVVYKSAGGNKWYTATDGSCNDIREDLIGTIATIATANAFTNGFTGVVTNICCTGISMDNLTHRYGPGIGTYIPGPAGVFEVHLELLGGDGSGEISPALGGYQEILKIPAKALSGNYQTGFAWDNAPRSLDVPEHDPPQVWILFFWGRTMVSNSATMYSQLSEFIHVGQGDCNVGIDLSTKNMTKQSYMFCLEDGTKKINFS